MDVDNRMYYFLLYSSTTKNLRPANEGRFSHGAWWMLQRAPTYSGSRSVSNHMLKGTHVLLPNVLTIVAVFKTAYVTLFQTHLCILKHNNTIPILLIITMKIILCYLILFTKSVGQTDNSYIMVAGSQIYECLSEYEFNLT